jgi:hypothetical protein
MSKSRHTEAQMIGAEQVEAAEGGRRWAWLTSMPPYFAFSSVERVFGHPTSLAEEAKQLRDESMSENA